MVSEWDFVAIRYHHHNTADILLPPLEEHLQLFSHQDKLARLCFSSTPSEWSGEQRRQGHSCFCIYAYAVVLV